MSKQSGSQTTRTEPPKYLQPFLREGMGAAQDLFHQGPAQYYPGQTVVGFSPETEQALNLQTQRATNGSPVMGAANSYALQALSEDSKNPYLDSMFNQAADQVTNRLQSSFAGSGRNIGAARPVAADELSQLATGIYGGAYDADQTRRNQILGMAPGLAAADYNDINRLADVGTRREDLTGRQLQDSQARWDFGQNAQGAALDQYLGRLQGYPGSQTTQPTYRNVGAGVAGGSMLGNLLFPGIGGVAGGILGGIFG